MQCSARGREEEYLVYHVFQRGLQEVSGQVLLGFVPRLGRHQRGDLIGTHLGCTGEGEQRGEKTKHKIDFMLRYVMLSYTYLAFTHPDESLLGF